MGILTKSRMYLWLKKKKVQTWGRRWRGGCAERCLWAAARSALRSGCGRPTAAAGSWRRWTEAAGWELAGAATAQCCPLLERSPGRRERSRAFRTQRHMIPSGHIVKTLIRASQWGKSFASASDLNFRVWEVGISVTDDISQRKELQTCQPAVGRMATTSK